jgi:predicted ATPase
MIFKLREIGHLRCAEIELSDLTVISGHNNTGKTYATYTIYGFLTYWWDKFELPIDSSVIDSLLNKGTVSINIHEFLANTKYILEQACSDYSKNINRVLSSSQDFLPSPTLEIELAEENILLLEEYDQTTGTDKGDLFSIYKGKESTSIDITLLTERGNIHVPPRIIRQRISHSIKRILFDKTFPNPVILVAERTGIEIFQTELDFARNRLIDTLKEVEGSVDPFDILFRTSSDYALPISHAVNSVRSIKERVKTQSYISLEYSYIINYLESIMGAETNYSKTGIFFTPTNNKRVRLRINEVSSSLRSLVDLMIYLKHDARRGDILMIDEPELNLHPENQRKLMHLFGMLINIGIKVYITTHSDYIVKELNNLILLNGLKQEDIKTFFKKYKYNEKMLIGSDRCSVYLATIDLVLLPKKAKRTKCSTVKRIEFGDYGYAIESYDDTINIMNEIQYLLIYGEE